MLTSIFLGPVLSRRPYGNREYFAGISKAPVQCRYLPDTVLSPFCLNSGDSSRRSVTKHNERAAH